jgi:phage terminase large subunit
MEINIDLSPKQSLAFDYLTNDETTEILYGGAAGGGKSYLGCVWIINNCINYPGTRWLIGRSKLKNLKQTTIKTFNEIITNWGLSNYVKINNISGEVHFWNGSEVMMKDLFHYPSDPEYDSLGGLEITGAFIDECNQISLKAKNVVTSRIRYKLDEYNLKPKLFMSCNPARNWVYEEFYKKSLDKSLEPYKAFIRALPGDNPHLSKHYVSNLEKLDETSRKRLLLGLWEYENEGNLFQHDNIIEMFDRDVDINYELPFYLSVDVARLGKDKCVIILWNALNIIRIWEFEKSTIDEIVNHIRLLMDEWKIKSENIIVDSDGVGGGVADYIKGCYNFINGGRPINGENYQNLKTQCYFKLSDMVNNQKIKIISYNDEVKNKIITELSIIKRVDIDSDGKLKITSKDEIKRQIGRSPDYSDAMMMRMVLELDMKTFYPGVIKTRINKNTSYW